MRYPRPTAAIWSWLARCTIIGVLLITMLAPSLTSAQEEFDLPPTVDDYTGLQAITANSVDGVNLRAEPNVESEILLSVPDGNIVDLRVDTVHTVSSGGIRWWPVSIWGVDGWVAGLYLASTDSTSPADADASTGTWAAGDYVAANTDNLAMRAGPGTNESRIAWLGLGDVVQIVDGPFMNGNSDWWLISDGSINAYVFGRYLTTASELDIQAPAADTPSFAAGDAAEIALGSGGANIREEADAKSDKLETLNEGVVVEVVDGPTYDADGAPWYLVKFTSDKRGFVIAEALAATSSDTSGLSSDAPVSSTGATGTFIYPIAKYTFTQGYGCTIYSFEPYNSDLGCYYHNGLDLAAPLGTALVASDGGTVLYAGWCDCGLGLYVAIDHGNGMSTLYGHMNAVYVTAGQKVTQGEQIGEVGSTGNSTGPHCHFIIKSGDSTVNPLDYLPPLSSS